MYLMGRQCSGSYTRLLHSLSPRSLLNLYRDCSLGDSDLDLSLDLTWWTPDNSLLLKEALIEAGFTRLHTFGKLGEAGYEESYTKTEVKVIQLIFTFKGPIYIPVKYLVITLQVDLFSATCTRFENKSSCSTGLWINGEYFECRFPLESIRRFRWWGGISVNLPYPVRDSLVTMYQQNFLHTFSDWLTHIHPFLTGYCLYN